MPHGENGPTHRPSWGLARGSSTKKGNALGKHIVLGLHLTDRMKEAAKVQEILSQYGCSIRTRIGLHDVNPQYCSPSGVILLEMYGDEGPIDDMADKLAAVEGVELQRMEFAH